MGQPKSLTANYANILFTICYTKTTILGAQGNASIGVFLALRLEECKYAA